MTVRSLRYQSQLARQELVRKQSEEGSTFYACEDQAITLLWFRFLSIPSDVVRAAFFFFLLLIAEARSHHKECTQMLASKSADIDAQNSNTPLQRDWPQQRHVCPTCIRKSKDAYSWNTMVLTMDTIGLFHSMCRS